MAHFMWPPLPAAPASSVDMIYVNHKMWRGDLTSVQLSSRTSPGRRASIYKQWYIHISVTCSIYTARTGPLLHKWNIIPRHVRFGFLSAVCFSFMHRPHCRWACRQLSLIHCHFQGSAVTSECGTPSQQTSKARNGDASCALWFPQSVLVQAGPLTLTAGSAATTQPFITAEPPVFTHSTPAHRILHLPWLCWWDMSS